MPLPNFHSVRLKDPNQFDKMRYEKDAFGKGIDVVWGIKNNKAHRQALRFDKEKFTISKVRAWIKEHDLEPLEIEGASEKSFVTIKMDPDDLINILEDSPLRASVSKSNEEKRLVYGMVLIPDKPDLHKDVITRDEIEKAAHDFMTNCMKMNVGHLEDVEDIVSVESYVAPVEFEMGNTTIPEGSWILVSKVLDDEKWKAVKNGTLTSYSIGASVTRRMLNE